MAHRLLSAVAMSDLLDLALKAHGGLDRWREVKNLDVRVSLTGALYHLKGYPEGVPNVTVTIDTRRPAVTISPTTTSKPAASRRSSSMSRGSCSGSIIWPLARPRTTASTTRITRESCSPRFAGYCGDHRPDRS